MSNLDAKRSLSADHLAILTSELTGRRKSLALALVLTLFSGPFGVQRWYVGSRRYALAMVTAFLGAFAIFLVQAFSLANLPRSEQATVIPWGIVPVLAVVLWSYIDAAWLPTIIRRTNERIENELIAQIRGEVPASGNIAQKLALSGHDLAVLECEMVGHRKHLLLAYGLAKFAGAFSAHRFYLGEITYAIATVCAGALACAALLAAVFLSVDHAADGSSAPIVVGALIVAFVVNGLVIVDEYRLPDVIERENLQIERDVMARLQPPALAQA